MDSLWQHIVIAVMVLVAAAYLALRWYQIRRDRERNPCGSCKCQLKQMHDLTARTGADSPIRRGDSDSEKGSDTSS